MNTVFLYQEKLKTLFLKNSKKAILAILIPVLLIVLVSVILVTVDKFQQQKISREYILELQKIENLDSEKRPEYIENLFNKSTNSLYKIYFGNKLINEIHRNNPDKAISIARQVLSIPNLPDYVSDSILTKLSYIYLDQLSGLTRSGNDISEKTKEITEFLEENQEKDSIFYPLQKEALLEILLANKNVDDYVNGLQELKKERSADLPSSMSARIDEMVEDIQIVGK